MRLRAVHLACVMLLLSSLGAASGSPTREHFSRGSLQMRALLQQNASSVAAGTTLRRSLDDDAIPGSIASPAPLRTAWAMRPPAAHSAHTHAVTGSAV